MKKETLEENYLFTTSDGVKVYVGDYYYYISKSGECFENCHALKKYMRDNEITFSTRELGEAYLVSIKPKQETLEEAVKTHVFNFYKKEDREVGKQSFIEGVKYQQERSYSEEEVRQIFNRYNEFIAHHDIEEWLEWIDKQFKKK